MPHLLDILDLEQVEDNRFRGKSFDPGWQRVFGGQVIAQALTAAQRTAPQDRFVHSLHAYFLLPGDPGHAILYEVERIRDGGSFSTRRVVAVQKGRAIFALSASFHGDEPGLEQQSAMPADLPDPEMLPSQRALAAGRAADLPEPVRQFLGRERPLDLRLIPMAGPTGGKAERRLWIRPSEPMPRDRAVQAAVLAYLSDMTLLDVAAFAHGRAVFDPDMQAASLDHAMWFHAAAPTDDWMLYCQDSPWSGGGRGLARGSLYARDGTLIASVAQEGLIRLRAPRVRSA